MKLTLTLAISLLTSFASAHPGKPSPTSATPTPTPTPTVYWPPLTPSSFAIKVYTHKKDHLAPLGYLTLPPPPLQAAPIHISPLSSSPTPFYFQRKISDGQGITWSSPSFFTPGTFALSYNATIPNSNSNPNSNGDGNGGGKKVKRSKMVMSDLLDNAESGLILVDMKATMVKGREGLWFEVVGDWVGGGFEVDVEGGRGEVWVVGGGWKYTTAYLQIVPIAA